MFKRLAYYIVYTDLIKIDLFKGKYDAKNGSKHYMNGIATVMEVIALRASEATYEKQVNLFIDNLLKSEEKYHV